MFVFCVSDVAHIGMGGYSKIGINSVFTSVVFTLDDKLLNLLRFVRTALPLFFTLVQ